MLSARVVWPSIIWQRGLTSDNEGISMKTPDNKVAHPTTRSPKTSLLDDDLVTNGAHCRMRDLVIAIVKVLVIRCYSNGWPRYRRYDCNRIATKSKNQGSKLSFNGRTRKMDHLYVHSPSLDHPVKFWSSIWKLKPRTVEACEGSDSAHLTCPFHLVDLSCVCQAGGLILKPPPPYIRCCWVGHGIIGMLASVTLPFRYIALLAAVLMVPCSLQLKSPHLTRVSGFTSACHPCCCLGDIWRRRRRPWSDECFFPFSFS